MTDYNCSCYKTTSAKPSTIICSCYNKTKIPIIDFIREYDKENGCEWHNTDQGIAKMMEKYLEMNK